MKSVNKALDQCIDRIRDGETVDACLVDYPREAKTLKPLLETVETVLLVCQNIPAKHIKANL